MAENCENHQDCKVPTKVHLPPCAFGMTLTSGDQEEGRNFKGTHGRWMPTPLSARSP